MSNITRAVFGGTKITTASQLWQYDYGQILQFVGINLPQTYEVHFGLSDTGTSTTQIGDEDGVTIPDIYLRTAGTIYAWVYLHTGEDDGETRYLAKIPVRARAEPTDQEPTPVQQDAITQAIAVLHAAVDEIGSLNFYIDARGHLIKGDEE